MQLAAWVPSCWQSLKEYAPVRWADGQVSGGVSGIWSCCGSEACMQMWTQNARGLWTLSSSPRTLSWPAGRTNFQHLMRPSLSGIMHALGRCACIFARQTVPFNTLSAPLPPSLSQDACTVLLEPAAVTPYPGPLLVLEECGFH